MQLGIVGLGRMGASMAQRLMRAGHEMFVSDINAAAVQSLVDAGAKGSAKLPDFIRAMAAPRAIWLMLPAAIVDSIIASLVPLLEPGDTIVDGGNSHYHDDIRRAGELKARGLHYVDVGVSGGVWGIERGYCQMIGGEPEVVRRLEPIFAALAPGVAAAPRSAGAIGDPAQAETGYLHCGANGAGHFVKMVHNGIEYGLMAAYAEGFNILKNANIGAVSQAADAETAPLENARLYQYDIDTAAVAELWRRGSVVGSWLLDLTALALRGGVDLKDFSGNVADSGEGRWTLQAAIDEGVPAPVISAALFSRFSSRGNDDYANRLLSAMRLQFGGHTEKPKDHQ